VVVVDEEEEDEDDEDDEDEDELELEVEVEVEVVEVEVELPERGTFVLGTGDPGQAEEPHPVRLIVANDRAMKNKCRNLRAVVGEKRTQTPSQ
jgi:hypothetical protein